MDKANVDEVETFGLTDLGNTGVEKWRKTGLLEGLNDKQSSILAQVLNNTAQSYSWMLKSLSTDRHYDYKVVLFPTVARVMRRLFESFGDRLEAATMPAVLYNGKPYVMQSKIIPSIPVVKCDSDLSCYSFDYEPDKITEFVDSVYDAVHKVIHEKGEGDAKILVYSFHFEDGCSGFRYALAE